MCRYIYTSLYIYIYTYIHILSSIYIYIYIYVFDVELLVSKCKRCLALTGHRRKYTWVTVWVSLTGQKPASIGLPSLSYVMCGLQQLFAWQLHYLRPARRMNAHITYIAKGALKLAGKGAASPQCCLSVAKGVTLSYLFFRNMGPTDVLHTIPGLSVLWFWYSICRVLTWSVMWPLILPPVTLNVTLNSGTCDP